MTPHREMFGERAAIAAILAGHSADDVGETDLLGRPRRRLSALDFGDRVLRALFIAIGALRAMDVETTDHNLLLMCVLMGVAPLDLPHVIEDLRREAGALQAAGGAA